MQLLVRDGVEGFEMALPSDIDPAVLAKLQAQGWLTPGGQLAPGPAPPPAPMAHQDPSMGYGSQGTPGDTRQDAIRQMITSPITPRPQMAPPGAAPAQGDFANTPNGAAPGTSAFKPPAAKAVPAQATSNVSPQTRQMYENAMQSQAAVPNEEAAATGTMNERQAHLLDEQEKALGAQSLEQANARRKRTDALDAQMADYKRLQDEASAEKINPEQWWGSKSFGEKALGVIGIILGGFSQGAGRGNPAMEMMNRMVDQNIEAQKSAIAGKQHRAEAAQNMYQQKLRQFGDENAAEMATRSQMLEQFNLQTRAEALRSQSPILQAKAKDVSAQIQLEQAKLHQGLEQWHQTGAAGGVTKEDAARAAELLKGGFGLTPNQALQAAMALRGAAPNEGLPAFTKPGAGGGKGSGMEAAAMLNQGTENPPSELSFGERLEAGLANAPIVGKAFQGTSGARKSLALKSANLPAMGYAHKGLGARTPEQQEHVAEPLLLKPSDNQARINQKMGLRAMIARGMITEAEAMKKLGISMSGTPSPQEAAEEAGEP